METLLRLILLPVATLLPEGPQLVAFCLQSGILPVLLLLLVIPSHLLLGIHLLHLLQTLLAPLPLLLETLATLNLPGTLRIRLNRH